MSFKLSDLSSASTLPSWQEILDTWDVEKEQQKADFLDVLYVLYDKSDGLYTGLWQAFKQDAAEFFRDHWNLELIDGEFRKK